MAIVAAGFAPLELDGKEDAERYDFQFEYNEETGEYELLTLYDRGYENWVGETSAGDAEFRDNFQQFFPSNSTDYTKESSGSSTLGAGLFACVIISRFRGNNWWFNYVHSEQRPWKNGYISDVGNRHSRFAGWNNACWSSRQSR